MKVYLNNSSKHTCLCSLNDGDFVTVLPQNKIAVDCADASQLRILVKHQYSSSHKKKKGMLKYYLVIDSEYTFDDANDGIQFDISYEKIRFSGFPAYYERFFLCTSQAVTVDEKHKVSNEDEIKAFYVKQNKNSFLRTLLLWGPLTSAPILGSGLILIGVAVSIFLGLHFGLVYFAILYLLLVIAELLGDLIGGKLFGSRKNERNQFFSFFTNEYISNYYAQLNREPFDDEYDTE